MSTRNTTLSERLSEAWNLLVSGEPSKKTAMIMESGSTISSPYEEESKELQRLESIISNGSPNSKEVIDAQAARSGILRKRNKDRLEKNKIDLDRRTGKEKAALIERGSLFLTRYLSVENVNVADKHDAINESLSKHFADADGNKLPSERTSSIIPKPDRTATLEIKGKDGSTRATIREFFVTDVSENSAEKFQIVQTFGNDYIFFYNRRPLIYTINGVFHNSVGKDWKNNFKANYDNFMRGTKLVEGRNKVLFTYDDVEREGYILSLNYSMNSNNTNAVPFSFNMFITAESMIANREKKTPSKNQNSGRSDNTAESSVRTFQE